MFKLNLKVVAVLFSTAFFSFISCVFVNFAFILLYSTSYSIWRTFVVPLENFEVVSFDCLKM